MPVMRNDHDGLLPCLQELLQDNDSGKQCKHKQAYANTCNRNSSGKISCCSPFAASPFWPRARSLRGHPGGSWAHREGGGPAGPRGEFFNAKKLLEQQTHSEASKASAKSDCANAIRMRQPPLNSLVGRCWSWIFRTSSEYIIDAYRTKSSPRLPATLPQPKTFCTPPPPPCGTCPNRLEEPKTQKSRITPSAHQIPGPHPRSPGRPGSPLPGPRNAESLRRHEPKRLLYNRTPPQTIPLQTVDTTPYMPFAFRCVLRHSLSTEFPDRLRSGLAL